MLAVALAPRFASGIAPEYPDHDCRGRLAAGQRLDFLIDAFSRREPVSTSLENAPGARTSARLPGLEVACVQPAIAEHGSIERL